VFKMPGLEDIIKAIVEEFSQLTTCLSSCCGIPVGCVSTPADILYGACDMFIGTCSNCCAGIPLAALLTLWSGCMAPSAFCGALCDVLTISFGIFGCCNTIWSIPQFCVYGGLSIGRQGGWEWGLERGGMRAILSSLTTCCDASMGIVDVPHQCISMTSEVLGKGGTVLDSVQSGAGSCCYLISYVLDFTGLCCCELPTTCMGIGYICCNMPKFTMDAVCAIQAIPSLLFDALHTLCDMPSRMVKICLGKDIAEAISGIVEPCSLCFLNLDQLTDVAGECCQPPTIF